VRYVKCDCGEGAPCLHALLAVWAFRRLPPDASGGYVSLGSAVAPVPAAALDELERVLLELARLGVAGVPAAVRDRLRRLAERLDEGGLVWPAEALLELGDQLAAYAEHDARFTPERVAELVGELLIRGDAIRSDTVAVPQPLVRGLGSDRELRLGRARFVGLGCGAELRRGSATLAAYLQDADSGTVVAVERCFADAPPDAASAGSAQRSQPATPPEPLPLAVLAGRHLRETLTLRGLGAGQLTCEGARRSASHRLTLSQKRGSWTLSPQTFEWALLRAPVLAEDFAEVRARLALLPPASLRPRRVAEDLQVCPVAAVEEARFRAATQTVEAILRDARGERALLVHPYTSRAATGCEALLAALTREGAAVRFVAAAARLLGPETLQLAPTAVVLERASGRAAVQPWVEVGASAAPLEAGVVEAAAPPLTEYPARLLGELGELLLLGLDRVGVEAARRFRDCCSAGEALGFDRLVAPVDRLATALEGKRGTARWDSAPAAALLLELALLARLASELG